MKAMARVLNAQLDNILIYATLRITDAAIVHAGGVARAFWDNTTAYTR
jgi:hypothetical protein